MGKQALKTQRTRGRIIDATVALICEGGFAAASSSRIAERAGMTWGAAQHHFGSKEDILEAILALSYEKFLATMGIPQLRKGSLTARADHFVDRMWTHYQTDLCFAALEILLGTREDHGHAARIWDQKQGRAHLKILREVFPEVKLSNSQLQEALVFAHCCLTGLRIKYLCDGRLPHLDRHLRRIKRATLLMLNGR